MRTKFLLLTTLCLFTFLSCNNDDDSNQNQDTEDFAITNENNLYVGDLYRLYLDSEIDVTNNLISSLQMQIALDPNNVTLINQLSEAVNQLEALESQETIQINIETTLLGVPRVPRVPPVPPQPCTAGACIPSLLDYLTISNDIETISIIFRNMQTEEEITSLEINQFTPLPEYNNIISTANLNFDGFSGEFFVDVESTNINNQQINFTVSGYIY